MGITQTLMKKSEKDLIKMTDDIINNAEDIRFGNDTMMGVAVKLGYTKLAQLILDNGGSFASMHFWVAAVKGYHEIIEIFMNSSVPKDINDIIEAANDAADKGHIKVVEILAKNKKVLKRLDSAKHIVKKLLNKKLGKYADLLGES